MHTAGQQQPSFRTCGHSRCTWLLPGAVHPEQRLPQAFLLSPRSLSNLTTGTAEVIPWCFVGKILVPLGQKESGLLYFAMYSGFMCSHVYAHPLFWSKLSGKKSFVLIF